MKNKILLTVLFSIGVLTFANAQPGQRMRMRDGIRSGEITRFEAGKARHDQREFRKDRQRFKRDGVITRHERKHLRKHRMHNNRKLHRKLHNRRFR